MPHIIIEKSNDISAQDTLEFLPKIQVEMEKIQGGNFALEACKARVLGFDEYFVGSKTQKTSAFFHITIKILAGRSTEIKQNLAQRIADIAKNFLESQKITKERADLSVDIVDMDKETYQKITL